MNVMYLATPLYVLFLQKGKAKIWCPKTRGCEGAMVISRDYITHKVKEILTNKPMWSPRVAPESKREFPHLLQISRRRMFPMSIPTFSIKTENNMHRKTPFSLEGRTRELPHWGTVPEFIKNYLQ
jgi:hypothetical protein